MLVLLNDDQVAASLCVGTLLEEIVGQTKGCHQVGLLKEQVHAVNILTVEIVAGGDEGHHAPVTHGIQSLLHEVSMQGLGDGTFHHRLVVAVDRVENLGIAKRDVGDGEVVLA